MRLRHGRKTIEKKFDNKEKLVCLLEARMAIEEKRYKSLLQVYKRNSGVLGEIYRTSSCNGVTRQF